MSKDTGPEEGDEGGDKGETKKTETAQLLDYLSRGNKEPEKKPEEEESPVKTADAKDVSEDWAFKAKQYEADMQAIHEVITGNPALAAEWLKVTDPDAYKAYQDKEKPATVAEAKKEPSAEDVNAKVQALFQKGDWVGGLALAQEVLGTKREVEELRKTVEQQRTEAQRVLAQDRVRGELAAFSDRHVADGLYEKDLDGKLRVKDVDLWKEMNKVLREYDIQFEDALGVAERRLGRSLKAQAMEDNKAQQANEARKRRATSAVAGATKSASSSVEDPIGFGIFQPDGFKAAFGEGVLADKREWK